MVKDPKGNIRIALPLLGASERRVHGQSGATAATFSTKHVGHFAFFFGGGLVEVDLPKISQDVMGCLSYGKGK